jgi:hypothetical protein
LKILLKKNIHFFLLIFSINYSVSIEWQNLRKTFFHLGEIKGRDAYSNSETFKSRITDPKRGFEPKGLKSFDGINYSNYISRE